MNDLFELIMKDYDNYSQKMDVDFCGYGMSFRMEGYYESKIDYKKAKEFLYIFRENCFSMYINNDEGRFLWLAIDCIYVTLLKISNDNYQMKIELKDMNSLESFGLYKKSYLEKNKVLESLNIKDDIKDNKKKRI